MRHRNDADADQLARARLAYVSAGQRPLTAPRRGLETVDHGDEPEEIPPASPPATWASRIPKQHVVALAIVLGVVAVVLALAWTRATAETIPVPPSTPIEVASSPPPPPAAGDGDDDGPKQVRVHVLGGVVSPGVVEVEEGAIVADAIAAAGGLAPDAVPGDLNLAAPVAAGMQIRVGTDDAESTVAGAAPATGGGGGGGAAGGPIDLNTATASQLEELPGVGPVMAGAIVAWREEHGRFTSTSELQEISGIGPKTFAKLEPLVTV